MANKSTNEDMINVMKEDIDEASDAHETHGRHLARDKQYLYRL